MACPPRTTLHNFCVTEQCTLILFSCRISWLKLLPKARQRMLHLLNQLTRATALTHLTAGHHTGLLQAVQLQARTTEEAMAPHHTRRAMDTSRKKDLVSDPGEGWVLVFCL